MAKATKIHSISELGEALCEARVAGGWTQRELGEHLGLRQQQIQRYEATDYQQCSWRRIIEIADALGIEISGRLSWPRGEAS